MRVLFITNLCPEYRIRPFELLARQHDTTFCFFSDGEEPYWDRRQKLGEPNVHKVGLSGFSPLPRLRITPGLIPLILKHDWDVIVKCINGRFALPVTYALSKLRRIPFVLWTGTWMQPRSLLHCLAAPMARRIYLGADAICVYGSHVARFLEAQGVDSKRIHLAPQNVDPRRFGRRPDPEKKQRWRKVLRLAEQPMVLYVGRLVPQKGLEDLLDAFSVVRNRIPATLVIAGEGPSRSGLEAWVNERMPDSVRFLGRVASDELPDLYSLATCIVLPSRTTKTIREPWGLVVNEAFHQGAPAVVTNGVGAAAGGLVEDAVNGFVVPEASPSEIARCLLKLLADVALHARLSAGAREAVRLWSPESMVDGFCRAIAQAATSSRH